MMLFDDDLRAALTANLGAHDRRELVLPDRRKAAVAVVILDDDADCNPDERLPGAAGGAAFLLCRRPDRMRRHPGQWSLPGGRLDRHESALDAALRELEEEIGIQLDPDAVVGWLDDYATRSGFVISPVVLWCASRPRIDIDPNEVAAVYRVGLEALEESGARLVQDPQIRRRILELPLGREVIYAPTGAVLHQLQMVGLHGKAGERVDLFDEPEFASR